MKKITIYYKGGLDEQLDDFLKDTFRRRSYEFIGSGFNLETQERDLEFESSPVPVETSDLLEEAWGIIANSHGGDWDTAQNKDWKPAAERWRDRYFKVLNKKK